jgi:molybdopterin synthase catalytic subunit
MLTLNVLYFAHVRERAGTAREALALPSGATVRDAVAAIVHRHPGVAELLPALRVALDGEFVDLGTALGDGSELVLIPPVSGGSGSLPAVALGAEPLDGARVAALQALVSGPGIGAVALFVGQVRDHARGRAVTRLEYEAYPSMAEKQLWAIVADLEARYPGTKVAIHHRTGELGVGDVAVVAAAGSAHRASAFDALREAIERLKADVPIWKREIGPDGAVWVSERP